MSVISGQAPPGRVADGPAADEAPAPDGDGGRAGRARSAAAARWLVRATRGTAFPIVCCASAVLASLWLTDGVWRDGVPTGLDTNAHLVRTRYALDHLYPQHELDGWQSAIGLGYQQSLFIGPVFSLAIGLVKALSLGALSTLGAFKATIVVSFCLLPLSVAVLAAAAGLGRRAAGIAAILSLAVNIGTGGIGVDSAFGTGLVVNHFSSPFVFLALASVAAVLRRPSLSRALLAGAAFGLLTVTHGLAVMITVFIATALVLCAGVEWLARNRATVRAAWHDWRRARLLTPVVAEDGTVLPIDEDLLPEPRLAPLTARVACLGAGAVIAAGLAAWVLVPIVMHPELRGVLTAFADMTPGEALAGIWDGTYVFSGIVGKLVLVGLVVMAVTWWRRPPLSLALVLAPFAFLAISSLYLAVVPVNAISHQLTVRAHGYVAMLAVLPLAALLGRPWRSTRRTPTLLALLGLRRAARHELASEGLNPFEIAVPVVIALAIVVLPMGPQREIATTALPAPALAAAAKVIEAEVPPQARFGAQEVDDARSGVADPAHWTAWETGRNTLNIFNVESSTVAAAGYAAHDLASMAPSDKAAQLARYGVTHVLVLDTGAAEAFVASPDVRVVWRHGDAAVVEILPRPNVPDPAALVAFPEGITGGRATVDPHGPQHLDFHVRSPRATPVSIAAAWSPKWEVTVNGRQVPARRTDEGLLRVMVDPGDNDISIRYAQDVWDLAGRAVALLTVVVLAAAVGSAAVRRRGISAGTVASA